MSKPNQLFGLLAEYTTAREIYRACETVRDAGYVRWDSHTPFPVHNLDKAMGLRSSPLPWIVFVAGMVGASGGFLLQWWASTMAYPIVVHGASHASLSHGRAALCPSVRWFDRSCSRGRRWTADEYGDGSARGRAAICRWPARHGLG